MKQLQHEIKEKKSYFLTAEDREIKKLLDNHPYNLFDITNSDRTHQQVIFIDEIQYLEHPSNFLKLIYDMFHENIKLVVSGSSSFYIDQKFKDSLMGRKEMYEMFTLDFEEFLDFKDEMEIKNLLFEQRKMPLLTAQRQKVSALFLEYITYGGYPEVVM
ncbi:MAG: AAA family ATPase [Candidatus Peribacteria bacterium]|nr:AAA family ATPase [Candidatus Peribacteria bacterium]